MILEAEATRPSLNQEIERVLHSSIDLLNDCYDLVNNKDFKEESKDAVLETAAKLKELNTELQSIVGADTAKKPKETEKDNEADREKKSDFLAGLKPEDEE